MEMAGIVRRNVVFLLVSAMAMGVGPAWGDPFIVGIARVIDGDTLEIRGQRIRLHGIDAPESGQFCEKDGKQYRCGQQAALALSDKIGRATIRCEQRDIDRYKRIIGVCFKGDQNLNRWMVQNGHAVAYRRYSQDYVPDELTATATRIGVWSGTFEMPWEWRKKHR
ncbi:MAG: thermonuclease family protein [Alphaproteobacteria bacterium]|nr:thermonuclease family protein [Alphaproteobacteria bacterium]